MKNIDFTKGIIKLSLNELKDHMVKLLWQEGIETFEVTEKMQYVKEPYIVTHLSMESEDNLVMFVDDDREFERQSSILMMFLDYQCTNITLYKNDNNDKDYIKIEFGKHKYITIKEI